MMLPIFFMCDLLPVCDLYLTASRITLLREGSSPRSASYLNTRPALSRTCLRCVIIRIQTACGVNDNSLAKEASFVRCRCILASRYELSESRNSKCIPQAEWY